MTGAETGAAKAIRKIPITLLTGFLGSGKTTLLRQMLTLPGWNETVVLVNELGEVGLDHHLLGTASDAVMLMENGCICCSVRDDLVGVLEDLFWKRLHRKMPYFKRVVVETTGLADPGPIVRALLSHPLIAERYALDSVLCTVDAMAGAAQLELHPECLAQAAMADALLITKTDCLGGNAGDNTDDSIINVDSNIDSDSDVMALEAALRELNPLAMLRRTVPGQLSPGLLEEIATCDRQCVPAAFGLGHDTEPAAAAVSTEPAVTDNAIPVPPAAPASAFRYLHHGRVQTTTLRFTRQWQWDDFEAALRATLTQHGEHILRIKGWLDLVGEPGPTVIQAVRQSLFAPEKLAAWPDEKHDSFLVCITTGLKPNTIGAAFRSHMVVN
jgi:G3E family GTPase